VTDAAVAELAPTIGIRVACEAVGVAQASYYRRHRAGPAPQRPTPTAHRDRPQPRALIGQERSAILDVLHRQRFVDLAPAQVWAALLDEGIYLGSISTFYRLLRQAGESRERRRQASHPASVKPELLATAPNQVWSWDITKLYGPAKWTYYHLYVILDIFSRYVVGWMVAHRESAALAEVLIRQTCAKQGIDAGQLTIHADRGPSMTSKPVAFLLADLGITQSHNRPHVSDDNPFSASRTNAAPFSRLHGGQRSSSLSRPRPVAEQARSTPWFRRSLRPLRSQRITVLSPLVARVCLSGAKATEYTGLKWPKRGWPSGRGWVRLVMSQSITVWSRRIRTCRRRYGLERLAAARPVAGQFLRRPRDRPGNHPPPASAHRKEPVAGRAG
jgi:putative transposase